MRGTLVSVPKDLAHPAPVEGIAARPVLQMRATAFPAQRGHMARALAALRAQAALLESTTAKVGGMRRPPVGSARLGPTLQPQGSFLAPPALQTTTAQAAARHHAPHVLPGSLAPPGLQCAAPWVVGAPWGQPLAPPVPRGPSPPPLAQPLQLPACSAAQAFTMPCLGAHHLLPACPAPPLPLRPPLPPLRWPHAQPAPRGPIPIHPALPPAPRAPRGPLAPMAHPRPASQGRLATAGHPSACSAARGPTAARGSSPAPPVHRASTAMRAPASAVRAPQGPSALRRDSMPPQPAPPAPPALPTPSRAARPLRTAQAAALGATARCRALPP